MASAHPSLETFGNGPHPTDRLFDLLRKAQEQCGHVTEAAMRQVAASCDIAVKDVHAVASFFPTFRLTAPAKAEVRVCTDMSCHLRGASKLLTEIGTQYREEVQAKACSCLGRCDKPVAVSVNGKIYSGADSAAVSEMVSAVLLGRPLPQISEPEPSIRFRSDPYDTPQQRYQTLREIVNARNPDAVLAKLKEGGLRGMGGAGFPTAIKWAGAKDAPGAIKYVICNADESEPGTIKDRYILQHAPHLVIEGMAIAGAVVGAREGIIYVRHEYEQLAQVLEQEIERCYRAGVLGNMFSSSVHFDLRVFVSPGGYICGEETALMEALQGKRGEPRNRPPRTVNHGLWGKPTALNNVETFALAVTILAKGGAWFSEQGRAPAQGLKFVGVSGDVKRPGAFEIPMGISYRELIDSYAGGVIDGASIVGFAPSGPSSGYLPASMLDLSIDWDVLRKAGSMVGSGAVVVCSDRACMLDMAVNAVTFYRNESCGKCVPCRVGSQKLVEMLTAWTRGEFHEGDRALFEELAHALRSTSICGLGQILPAPIASVMKHFPEEVEDHLVRRKCRAGICFGGRA